MQNNLKNIAVNKRMIVHENLHANSNKEVQKWSSKKISIGYKPAKMTKRANPVIPYFAEFCPLTPPPHPPFFIPFSDAL